MKKQRRFLLGAALVSGMVIYLMATGMRDSMIYYHTPAELVAQISADPTYREVGVKIAGRVVPGSVRFEQRTLSLSFRLLDIEDGSTEVPVHYQGPLPDTFAEGVDVVVEGRMSEAGTFEASTLLTKCGSRYEATEEDYELQ